LPGPDGAALASRLAQILENFRRLTEQMADPEALSDSNRLRELAREHGRLASAAAAAEQHLRLLEELEEAREITADPDPEIAELARMELATLEERRDANRAEIERLLVPPDPLDDRPAVVEIRVGTGGDEAALFAADLQRMYLRYSADEKWTTEQVTLREGVLGGIKEAVFIARGKGAYGKLRFESGVHRVQRVPATESQGRIHTSAATVAVLPEAEDVDVEIDPADVKVDVFRSSGPGGQSVNTTDSAVRLTHLPTGLVVSCQDEKSQHKNKAKAMKVLRSRLLDRAIAEQEAQRSRERRAQVSTGDRSAKIRTYNFPQNRVTDHRIGLTLHRLEAILGGDLTELIDRLRAAQARERLAELADGG